MRPRRSHRKSRHGCAECKRRRVKCDETRPTCTNCSDRGTECKYGFTSSLLWTNEKSPTSSPDTPQNRELLFNEAASVKILRTFSDREKATHSPPDLNLANLELMIQWCSETYRVFSRNEKNETIWKRLVPLEALSHPFLMHGLLAVSALHLSHTKSEEFKREFISTASAHQDQALNLFRRLLNSINASNAKAMFAFSTIIVVYSFGFPPVPNLDNTLAPVDDLYQVLILSRGIFHILKSPEVSLRGTDFEPIMEYGEYPQLLPPEAQLSLKQLQDANHSCGEKYKDHDTSIYQKPIESLYEALGTIYGGSPMMSVASKWAISLPRKYLDYLQGREPLALVILSFYSVVLHHLRDLWCVEDWGMRLSRAIWLSLDDQWRPLAHWPMTEIFGEIPRR